LLTDFATWIIALFSVELTLVLPQAKQEWLVFVESGRYERIKKLFLREMHYKNLIVDADNSIHDQFN